MKVINVAGFEIKFEKQGKIYRVPNDGMLHVIPDECFFEDNFQGLLRVVVPPQQVKKVLKTIETPKIDINDQEIKEIIIEKIEEKQNKPLIGKKLSKSVREAAKKKRASARSNVLVEDKTKIEDKTKVEVKEEANDVV